MSEKQVREHYAGKEVKPTFFTIRNDSTKLFCATTGADTLPPLLLIHGAPGGWFSGIGILDDPELQKRFHIIAIDRPGYHYTRFKGKRKVVTSIQTQATIIHEAMRLNRSHKKGVLYGTSYGAPIALKIAANHPEEFYHLMLVAGAVDPDNEKFWWFHKYARGLFVRILMPHFINSATDEKFSHVEELRKMLPDWDRINMPVTVIQGTADSIVSPKNFDFAKEKLRGKKAEFILLPGAGHMVRRSHPEVIREVLLRVAGTQ